MSKIILVEDDVDLQDLVIEMLESLGYDVLACSNRDQAYKAMMHCRPDAVLMDYSMPGMTLASFLALTADTFPLSRIVLFSADNAGGEAMNHGIRHSISKPIDIPELERTLGELCKAPISLAASQDCPTRPSQPARK